jgi:hypothetical protein
MQAKITNTNRSGIQDSARYREHAELARREAERADGEVRESFLFLADQWEQLARLAQRRESARGSAR